MKRRKLIAIVMISIMILILGGCKKKVSDIEASRVGTIVGTEYHGSRVIPHVTSINGRTTTRMQYVSAKYYVTVSCGDLTETFNDEDFYNYAKDKENETILLTIRSVTYEDGTMKETIIDYTYEEEE